MKDWIVMSGQPVMTTTGGGFEFFGPFTEEQAKIVREKLADSRGERVSIAIQLLGVFNRTLFREGGSMTERQYEVFFDILDQIVEDRGSGPWQDRKEALITHASERDITNLQELASWIEE